MYPPVFFCLDASMSCTLSLSILPIFSEVKRHGRHSNAHQRWCHSRKNFKICFPSSHRRGTGFMGCLAWQIRFCHRWGLGRIAFVRNLKHRCRCCDVWSYVRPEFKACSPWNTVIGISRMSGELGISSRIPIACHQMLSILVHGKGDGKTSSAQLRPWVGRCPGIWE